MHRYFIKTPWIAKKLFPNYIWNLPARQNEVYLTFDDGPHPTITPWVLNELKRFNAHATFFCIGNNVQRFPEIYRAIIDEGHAVGNHTYHHLNGWKTEEKKYLKDIEEASLLIRSNLFRPPYGRIKSKQAQQIKSAIRSDNARIIMWDVLSGDFDQYYSGEQCVDNVVENTGPGAIIVFHDSEKAFQNLEYALPKVLEYLNNDGYIFKKIEVS
jgi:peptidoglycan/xylan/chitin deacetylase (PgdA/CDA1 family)